MKFYLASRYSDHPRMQGVRDVLVGLGHEVTSRWIDLHGGMQLESATNAVLNQQPESVVHFAEHDIEDLEAADIVLAFTPEEGGGKGGRHVEFGYALGQKKPIVLIGRRENVFHTLPQLQHYSSWPIFVIGLQRNEITA